MAKVAQVQKLRRKLNDTYHKGTGALLTPEQHAFKDEELMNIIDDAVAEATDGEATAETANPMQESWAMLLARIDGILQIAQDEARRIRWQTNNEVVDPSTVADNLVKVAGQLQKRYEQARARKTQEKIAGVSNPSTGGVAVFNTSVRSNSLRNFDNPTVRRNSSPDH